MNTVKIALLGFGTVGTGTYQIIENNKEEIEKRSGYKIEITKILVGDLNKKRRITPAKGVLTTDYNSILDDSEIQIVVELIGGIEPARNYILRGIEKGKHIVTANKAVMAADGTNLLKAARDNGVDLYYEGSVAGGIPIIHSIKESLTANKVEKIMGIINGTTNYILTKMSKEGRDFGTVLKEAQEKGYAEADPTADIEGYDAANKLAILASLAFGTDVSLDKVYREGITEITPGDIEYARELGLVIKLLAISRIGENGLELRVHPTLIPYSHPLASVSDVFNAIFLKGNAVGELMFYGRGAGDLPTGSAVVGDIVTILKHKKCLSHGQNLESSHWSMEICPIEKTMSEYYIRLEVYDKPGVLGKIATVFGEHKVSLSSVIQKGKDEPTVSLVFVTHVTTEEQIRRALKIITSMDEVSKLGNIIRLENGH
jgi:homoserine dehydrogenase